VRDLSDRHVTIALIDRLNLLLQLLLLLLYLLGSTVTQRSFIGTQPRIKEQNRQTDHTKTDVEHRPPTRNRMVQLSQIAIPNVTGILGLLNGLAQPCPL